MTAVLFRYADSFTLILFCIYFFLMVLYRICQRDVVESSLASLEAASTT